jgi:MFS family permease
MEQTVPAYKETNLKIIFSVTLMVVMGVASITPAFPEIVERLGITTKEVGLLITVFTFPGILLTPLMGILGDRWGRKKVLVPSLMLFGIAGPVCAFMNDFNLLLVFRFFQGVGAASLASLSTTLIGDLYTGNRLNEAMGYNASVLSIGTASYPAIGGLLASFGWHYPFLLPVAALPVGLLVLFKLKNPEPKNKQNLKDYLKNALKIFQNKEVIALVITIMAVFIILYGAFLTYFPFLMRGSFQSTTLTIGLWMSITSVVSGTVSSQLGKWSKRYPLKYFLLAGFILYAVSLVLFAIVTRAWMVMLPLGLFGAGNGLIIPTTQGMLTRLSPMQYRAAFMAANGMTLRIGQTIGPIMMGFFFGLAGLKGAFLAGVGVALLMLVLVGTMITKSAGRENSG